MLDMGFRDDIQKILESTPDERQTVFFSATLSKPIRDLINRFSRNPEMVKIEQKELTVPTVEQWFYEVPPRMKMEAFIRLVDFHGYKLGIIFCNTQRMVDELADSLLAQGFSTDRLHGGIPQAQRTRVMNKFKNSEFEFLVATDVAARGIDVDDLELVVNYDLPYDPEDYVHRIGRTGRAGRKGMAITFVTGRDIYKLQFIERYTKTKIRRGMIPTAVEVEGKRSELLYQKLLKTLQEGKFKKHEVIMDRLLEDGNNSTDISAALFSMMLGSSSDAPAAPAQAPRKESGSSSRDREAEDAHFARSKGDKGKSFSSGGPNRSGGSGGYGSGSGGGYAGGPDRGGDRRGGQGGSGGSRGGDYRGGSGGAGRSGDFKKGGAPFNKGPVRKYSKAPR